MPESGACQSVGLSWLPPFPSSMRTAATTPAEPAGASVARFPASGSLPRIRAGSASASPFSRPAQRSLRVAARMAAAPPRRAFYLECFEQCRYLHHPLQLLPVESGGGAVPARALFPHSRSPNPACRFPAPGSPVGSCFSHTDHRPKNGLTGSGEVAPPGVVWPRHGGQTCKSGVPAGRRAGSRLDGQQTRFTSFA